MAKPEAIELSASALRSSERLSPRLLIVDDEPGIRQMLEILFGRCGYATTVAAGRNAAERLIRESPLPFQVVITDLVMPGGSGLEVLALAKARCSNTEVLLMTAYSSVDNAIEAMRLGAYDFITKPFDPESVAVLVSKALEKHAIVTENVRLKAQVSRLRSTQLLGRSLAMRQVLELIQRIANTRTTVLISGESGTGKERVARAIHEQSNREDRPFLVINCGALPETLMESELFGHERGAFTGAATARPGLFREASGGTLLLDEVGELPLSLQVKLLRVLQERCVKPLGSDVEVPVDVRVLAATNRDVEAEVSVGKFRQDLYYRLNVIRLVLPPLRERTEDIELLTTSFLQRFAKEMDKLVVGFTPDAVRSLRSYPFPGNVRELENVVERAVALATGQVIGLHDLPAEVSGEAGVSSSSGFELPAEGCDLEEVMNDVERRLIMEALERTGGVRTAAARLLGITFRSLRYRLEKQALPDEAATTIVVGDEQQLRSCS